jgi:hypothetical protein
MTMNADTDTSDNYQVLKIKERIAELQGAIDEQLPNFKTILKDIHTTLRADPHVVTILEPEEIAVIVGGLEKHADLEIAGDVVKKATKGGRKAPISADML